MLKRTLITLAFLGLLASCTDQDTQELKNLEEEIKTTTETARKNKASVRAFFQALEDEDITQLLSLFADNGKQINPYASGLFPEGAAGKEALKAYWSPVPDNFDGMKFPLEELYAMEDPNIVFVKYQGRIKLKNDAGMYQNDYYSIFKFNASGLIVEHVEIFNPILAARGFGLIDQIK
jgi:phenazine biosynthesis protein